MDNKNFWENAEHQHQSPHVVAPQPLPPIPSLNQPDVQDAHLHPTAMKPQLDEDIQTAKKIVSFSITLIMIVRVNITVNVFECTILSKMPQCNLSISTKTMPILMVTE